MKNTIKQKRLNQNLTQIEFCRMVDISERYLRNIEANKVYPRVDLALKMTLELTGTYDVTKIWVIK